MTKAKQGPDEAERTEYARFGRLREIDLERSRGRSYMPHLLDNTKDNQDARSRGGPLSCCVESSDEDPRSKVKGSSDTFNVVGWRSALGLYVDRRMSVR